MKYYWTIKRGKDKKKYKWGIIGRLKRYCRNNNAEDRTIKTHSIKFSKNNNDRDKEIYKYWPFSRDARGLARTILFEFKYWSFPKKSKKHEATQKHEPKINYSTIEYNFIIEGETEGTVGEDKINLKAGDYVIIKPGFVINLQDNIKKDLMGITIKTPYFREDDDKITEKDFSKLIKENDLAKLIKSKDFRKLFKNNK